MFAVHQTLVNRAEQSLEHCSLHVSHLPPACLLVSILVFTCRLTTELRLVRWTTHPTAGPACCESRHQRYWMRDTNNTNTYTSTTPVKQFNTHLYTCPRGHLTSSDRSQRVQCGLRTWQGGGGCGEGSVPVQRGLRGRQQAKRDRLARRCH